MRQIIGKAEESITIPADVTTVSGLIDFLKGRDDAYAAAFATPRIIRANSKGRRRSWQAP